MASVFRWLGCVFLVLIGLALLVPGWWIAVNTDWQPSKNLHESERDRIRAARTFVERHRTEAGRLPTTVEFESWVKTAPSELRMDGVGFGYQESGSDSYAFSWWGGESWLWWKSNHDLDRADISPKDYFLFGNKLLDVLFFFGLAVAALWAAKRTAPLKWPRAG